MAAIGLVSALKTKRQEESAGGDVMEYEWGSAKVLNEIDITELPRQKLKNHLEARDLETKGNKQVLIDRLRESLEQERLQSIAYTEALEAEFKISKDLEERGSCYSVGSGHAGQLGHGDLDNRNVFTPIAKTMGAAVVRVSTGYDLVYAITEDHDVLVWGGSGVGPMGVTTEHDAPDRFMEPRAIRSLQGEGVVQVEVGASHSVAISAGGDCFVWGHNSVGQLGLGHYDRCEEPEVMHGIPSSMPLMSISVGENHSMAIAGTAKDNRAYVWGHVGDGRLGLGTRKRIGAREEEAQYFPGPAIVDNLVKFKVQQVACGATHCCVRTEGALWTWGHGAGGRLGLGDADDRYQPNLVETFAGRIVIDVSAGTWHSAVVVMVPPLNGAGEVWTWGSGYHGQLGQNNKQVSLVPGRVKEINDWHIFAKRVVCGPFHNAIITHDGELFTWGSNKNNCLGHEIDEVDVAYTPTPGHCGGFGALVERVGRGMVRDVTCGKEFTIVCTFPYEGPSERVAQTLMEEEELRLEEERIQKEEEELERQRAEKQRLKELEKAKRAARKQAAMEGDDQAAAAADVEAKFAAGADGEQAADVLSKDMGTRKG